VERHAGELLKYEHRDDLVQLVQLRAIEKGAGFRYEGEEAFRGWLLELARNCLADRRDYWRARKRRPDRLLHLTGTSSDAIARGGAAPEPPSSKPGPLTSASRREELRMAARALGTLLDRDCKLVRWTAEDVPLAEQAERLKISYDAAEKARARALERFRRAYELVVRRSGG
jgi:RNA polymerase sigma factor (sigma-70 family)